MKKVENFKKIFLLMSVVFIVAGLFLILNPQISQQAVGMLIGVIFILYGAIKLIGFIVNAGLKSETTFDFVNALLNIGLGMFVIYNHGTVLTVAAMIIGIITGFESIMRIATAFELKNSHYEKWKNELVFGIISALIALFIIFNPFKTVIAVYIVIGIAMTVYGLFRLWSAFKVSEIFKALEPVETTAVVTDDTNGLPDSDNDNKE